MNDKPSSNPSGFVDINELRTAQPVTVERLFQYYGVSAPNVLSSGKELRLACPFSHCGRKGPTSPKAIAIQNDTRGFVFRCFHYGCSHGGNDVGFADLLRDNQGDGRPRGDRFKQIVREYQDMADGAACRTVAVASSADRTANEKELAANVPLEESDNEKARGLVDLPAKLIADPAKLPPSVAAYQRSRPHWFADPAKILADWQVGYLPMDSGGDRTGGTLRGRLVFPIRSLEGRLLAFAGRDCDYETKHRDWLSLPEEKRSQSAEPGKYRFPKSENFRKSLELWGQERIVVRGSKKKLKEQGGLWVAEGPGDIIRLSLGNILAVGLMSNQPTHQQIEKITRLAWDYADGHVQLMLDLDEEGRKGAWKLLQELSPHAYVRMVWTSAGGTNQWANKQPEQLSDGELTELRANLDKHRTERKPPPPAEPA